MKVNVRVNQRIERLYEEYMTLIEDLRVKTKEERMELYDGMTRTLFPHATRSLPQRSALSVI